MASMAVHLQHRVPSLVKMKYYIHLSSQALGSFTKWKPKQIGIFHSCKTSMSPATTIYQSFKADRPGILPPHSQRYVTTAKMDDAVKPVTHVLLDGKSRMLETRWHDKSLTRYPLVWLRDNCQCDLCFNKASSTRIMLMRNLDPFIDATDVTVDASNACVKIVWSDGHMSPYPFRWLEERSFTETAYRERARWYRAKPTLWGSELKDRVPSDTFDNIMSDDHSLYNWIKTLEETGIFLLKEAPTEPGQLHRVADRVAYLRKTNYGETFMVYTKEDPSNAAYTSGILGFHTDLSYFGYQPGMQMLHCISQPGDQVGGDNQFVDGFKVAEKMRQDYPEYFRLLTSYPLDYYDIGDDFIKFHQLTRQPTIRLNHVGDLERINYSTHGRDSFMNALPLEAIQPMYCALKMFEDILMHPDNRIEFKLIPGDIVCVDNQRVLHARSAYQASGSGARHLEGGYIDWDELSSKKRVLMGALDMTTRGS